MKAYYFGNPSASTVLFQPIQPDTLSLMPDEAAQIRRLTNDADFLLVAMATSHWNDDLSPWPAPAVFKSTYFHGKASQTLSAVTAQIALLRQDNPAISRRFYLGGYSLAGLFSLWSAYFLDGLAGIAAASPSVWFPGFYDFVTAHTLRTDAVYLSLGTKEERTTHPLLSQVGNAIRAIHDHLQAQPISCTLEWNEGNHFKDPIARTAKGFAWLLTNR